MRGRIDELLDRIQRMHEELEAELSARRAALADGLREKRARFAAELHGREALYRIGLIRYIAGARWQVALTAPLIYLGIVPFALVDLFVTIYQSVCFRAYGIPRARRADFMVFDRGDLPYLNLLERINCAYCSYANGVAGYFREVAARTEQYWCPIKHARRLLAGHERNAVFFDFGDAEGYRKGLDRLREQYRRDALH